MKKVYTVIVSYNGAKWIRKCLESLKSSSCGTQVIVVDNGSVDDTLQIIKQEFRGVIVLEQDDNLGFGRANNIGVSHALKQGADYVFLLNQDAYLDKECLSNLIKVSEENPGFGILSPIQLNWEGTHLEYYFSRFIGENSDFYSDFVLGKKKQNIYEVPFVNAASWLLTREVLKMVGGFDPIFFHYGEDNNFCQRTHFHGLKIGVVSGNYIFHDSKVRREPENYLFSDYYFRNEVKNWKIKYADVNENYGEYDFRSERRHILKLILLNVMKLKFNSVRGYLKKYKLFKQEVKEIRGSRRVNVKPLPHYLEF